MSSFLRAFVAALLAGALLGACSDGGSGPPAAVTPASSPPPTMASPGPTEVHATEVPPLHPSVDDYPSAVVEIVADGMTHRLAVLVADTPERRQHGLMEVPELPDGVGMLFTGYDTDRSSGFWMKNTLVPLTIAYLDADGVIVDLVDMEPCTEDPCPSYAPDRAYRSALELRQGWFGDNDVAEGAVVRSTADE